MPTTASTRIALILGALFAVVDIAVSAGELGGNLIQPIALIVLGVLTLVGIPFAWRGTYWALVLVAATRVLSALSTLPVYFSADTQGVPQVVATVWIFISILIAVLLLRAASLSRPARQVGRVGSDQ
jgi:hypothetical protein